MEDAADGPSAAVLKIACHGEGSHDTGEVRVDLVRGVEVDGAGGEVSFGHAKRLLHVPQLVVGGDDLGPGSGVFGQVGDVALETQGLSGPFNEGLIDHGGIASQGEESVLAQGTPTCRDVLGAGDLSTQGTFFPFGPGEPVLVDNAALARSCRYP